MARSWTFIPPQDELRHDSRNGARDGTNGSDDGDELRLRHIRTAPHRLTLLQLQQARLDAIQRSEDPVDLSITHITRESLGQSDNSRQSVDPHCPLRPLFYSRQG